MSKWMLLSMNKSLTITSSGENSIIEDKDFVLDLTLLVLELLENFQENSNSKSMSSPMSEPEIIINT